MARKLDYYCAARLRVEDINFCIHKVTLLQSEGLHHVVSFELLDWLKIYEPRGSEYQISQSDRKCFTLKMKHRCRHLSLLSDRQSRVNGESLCKNCCVPLLDAVANAMKWVYVKCA